MQQLVARLRDKETKLAKDKKGFTLVELIVVLVILAILAAILVPTLIGYINRANAEKDYSTAQTVRVAAQSTIDQQIADGTIATTNKKVTPGTFNKEKDTNNDVLTLAGVNTSNVSDFSFDYNADGQITGGTVTINGHTYTLKTDDSGKNNWSAA